jgi:CBS-domain-containing membrane protein
MNIGSICSRRIVVIDAARPLVEAARLMREHHVGALVVTRQTSEGVHVKGVVTDRDLVIDVLARGLDAAGVEVGALASEKLVSVAESAAIDQAIEAMHGGGVRRLLVTDAEDRLVGIVSLDDLIGACAGQLSGLARIVEREIAREAAEPPAPPSPRPSLRVPRMGTAGWQGSIP